MTKFEKEPLPYFLTIPWHLAEVGNTLRLTKDQYVKKSNFNEIKIRARAQSVFITIVDMEDDQILIVVDDVSSKYNGVEQSDIARVLDYIRSHNGRYVPFIDVFGNSSWPKNPQHFRKFIKQMVKDGVLIEKPLTRPQGGRPTTQYKVKE